MRDEHDPLAGIDLSAWEVPAPRAGLADAVIARARQPERITAPRPSARRSRRWPWIAGALAVSTAAAVALALWGVERAPVPASGYGEAFAQEARTLALGPSSASMDPGAHVRWRRDGRRIHVEHDRGAVTWNVDARDTLVIDASAMGALVEASGAGLRMEVEMNQPETRAATASSATAMLAALATLTVYQGHVQVTQGGQTVRVAPGAALELRSPEAPPAPIAVGAGPVRHPSSDVKRVEHAMACEVLEAHHAIGRAHLVDKKFTAALQSFEAGLRIEASDIEPGGCVMDPPLARLAVTAACGAKEPHKAQRYLDRLVGEPDIEELVASCKLHGVELRPAPVAVAGVPPSRSVDPQRPSPTSVKATGELAIVTPDGWADVELDGVKKGRTPMILRGLNPGRHRVRATWPDGGAAEKLVDVKPGSRTELRLFAPDAVSDADQSSPPADTSPGELEVAEVPPGVTIAINDRELAPTAGNVFPLPPGKYRVGLLRDGKMFREKIITISAGDRTRVRFSGPWPSQAAVPATGDLVVTSVPPKLDVRVDGKVIGMTPMRVPQAVGQHHVAIMQDDTIVYAETVAVRERDQTFVHGDATVAAIASSAPTASPATGDLIVTSVPSGLVVRANGKVIGRTPIRVPQSVGLYHVAIMQNDGVLYAETVAVKARGAAFVHGEASPGASTPTPASAAQGVPSPMSASAPQGATGDLIVTSMPSKLPVRVDSKVIGQTPLRVTQKVGLHHVAIMQGDRVIYAETVEVREREQAFVHGDAPAFGKGGLIVTSTPSKLEVRVDGRVFGQTPLRTELPIGRYEVSVMKAGKVWRAHTVDIKGGEETFVESH